MLVFIPTLIKSSEYFKITMNLSPIQPKYTRAPIDLEDLVATSQRNYFIYDKYCKELAIPNLSGTQFQNETLKKLYLVPAWFVHCRANEEIARMEKDFALTFVPHSLYVEYEKYCSENGLNKVLNPCLPYESYTVTLEFIDYQIQKEKKTFKRVK